MRRHGVSGSRNSSRTIIGGRKNLGIWQPEPNSSEPPVQNSATTGRSFLLPCKLRYVLCFCETRRHNIGNTKVLGRSMTEIARANTSKQCMANKCCR